MNEQDNEKSGLVFEDQYAYKENATLYAIRLNYFDPGTKTLSGPYTGQVEWKVGKSRVIAPDDDGFFTVPLEVFSPFDIQLRKYLQRSKSLFGFYWFHLLAYSPEEVIRKHFLLGRLARDEGSFCLSECILKSANIILEGIFKESFFTEKVDEINRAIELYEEMLSDYVNPNKFPEALVKIVNGKIDESTLKSRLVRPY